MDHVKVLVTGAGAPGIKGTLYSLLHNWDSRKVTTIGVDMKDDVLGKYLCNKYYKVPPGLDPGFSQAVLEICEKEQVDVVLPQVTSELSALSRSKEAFEKAGIRIALSDYRAISIANDKKRLLEALSEMGEPHPAFLPVRNEEDLLKAGDRLGFPFVVKPPESSGMRGFRVVYEQIDRKRAFFEDKPDNAALTMEELQAILGESFPELIAMEYLPGPEYSVDILSARDRILTIVPRKRDQIRSGITFNGIVEQREDIIRVCERLTRLIGLEYAHGFQFKENALGQPMLLESNPRVQGTMVLSTLAGVNVIYGAVKMALGEDIPQFHVDWGTRLLRYWGGVGIGKTVVEL